VEGVPTLLEEVPNERPTAKQLYALLAQMPSSDSALARGTTQINTEPQPGAVSVADKLEQLAIAASSRTVTLKPVSTSSTPAPSTPKNEGNPMTSSIRPPESDPKRGANALIIEKARKAKFDADAVAAAQRSFATSAARNAPPVGAEVKNLLRNLETRPCPGGYRWADAPREGGFRCDGGTHFMTYAAARTGIANKRPLRTDVTHMLEILEEFDPSL